MLDKILKDPDLDEFRKAHGAYYSLICKVPGRGICGIQRMIYTVEVFYNMNMIGPGGRYCFHTSYEAIVALATWDGEGDPPGNWIKHFGEGDERNNPDYEPESGYSG